MEFSASITCACACTHTCEMATNGGAIFSLLSESTLQPSQQSLKISNHFKPGDYDVGFISSRQSGGSICIYTTLWDQDYAHHWNESEQGLYPFWIILFLGPETDMDYCLVYCHQWRVFSPSEYRVQKSETVTQVPLALELSNTYSEQLVIFFVLLEAVNGCVCFVWSVILKRVTNELWILSFDKYHVWTYLCLQHYVSALRSWDKNINQIVFKKTWYISAWLSFSSVTLSTPTKVSESYFLIAAT